jgi:hypothetical protein
MMVKIESCSRVMTKVSVFPAAASLQTGFPLRSNTFQLLCFLFLTPDTLRFGAWILGFHKFASNLQPQTSNGISLPCALYLEPFPF